MFIQLLALGLQKEYSHLLGVLEKCQQTITGKCQTRENSGAHKGKCEKARRTV